MSLLPEDLRQQLNTHVERWPGRGAAGVVQRAAPTPVSSGDADFPFAWASVTKLLVALSCMVAVEEGTIALDDPCGPPGSTVAHLLAHASGLPFEGRAPLSAPAHRRIYSNAGIELAAAHLGGRAGMPFTDYLHAGVLEPLGMNATTLAGSAAHGAAGPLSDLLRLAGEMLAPTLVSAPTWRQAVSVAWPGLGGVLPGFGRQDPCDWGLGPEIRGHKSPHWTGQANSERTFGHFGQSGSFLWVDPGAGVALCGLSDTAFGPWAKEAWPALADDVLALSQQP